MALAAGALAAARARPARAAERQWRIGFANLTEDPAERLEGLGFTGAEVRASFIYAARGQPIEMVFFDNDRNREKTVANASEAIRRKLDLLIEYSADETANAEVARLTKAARLPVIAIDHAVPGAPLYTADRRQAGRIAGEALAAFAQRSWTTEPVVAVVLGDVGNKLTGAAECAEGIAAALKEKPPRLEATRLDSGGNPGRAEGLLRRFAEQQSGKKLLVATLDDATALSAKNALEAVSRSIDAAIVSQGCDRSMHGGMNEKREIDPQNRSSIVLGSVAYFLDRYGYDVLPLALAMLDGQEVPPRTVTQHVLVTSSNVFRLYPPADLQ